MLASLVGALVAGVVAATAVGAQVVDTRWSEPVEISSADGDVYRGTVVADEAGVFHVVWDERGFADRRVRRRYARFDGTWTPSVEIRAAKPGYHVGPLALAVDAGTLHVAWTESDVPHTLGELPAVAPILHTSVPLARTQDPSAWSAPSVIRASAAWVRLRAGPAGTLHLLSAEGFGEPKGIFYRRSEDAGLRWSAPVRVGREVPDSHYPWKPDLTVDVGGVLHAVWEERMGTDTLAILYASSADVGRTWSDPFTLAAVGADPKEIPYGYPNLAVAGRDVHVVWTGGDPNRVGRRWRVSRDGGTSWDAPVAILNGLEGFTSSEALLAAPDGTVHLFEQLRFPQGIYEATADAQAWGKPALVYKIAQDAADSMGARLHAHRLDLAMARDRALLLFTTEPLPGTRVRLYAMAGRIPEPAAAKRMPADH